MVKHKILTTDQDIENAAVKSAASPREPRVTAVHLATTDDETLLVLTMDDESRHYIPKAKLERLENTADQVISNVEISDDGLGLRWRELDLDLYVPALLHGVYGTEKWMASLGQRGGRVRSEAKSRAARENGRKGGRPRRAKTNEAPRHLEPIAEEPGSLTCKGGIVCRSRRRRQYGAIPHSKAKFAILFGFHVNTHARALPRIA